MFVKDWKSGRSGTNCNRNQTTRIQVCSGKSGSHWCGTDGRSTYDYGLRETTYLDKIKSPRTTHEGGADIKYGRFLDELGWEFNQEGRRRQDLIRFGVWTTKSWLSHSATNDINKNLYPIPRAELDKNGKLKQNPGY